MPWRLDDLSLAGLTFDLVGALILGRAVLMTPWLITHLGTWAGLGIGGQVDRARARVDGSFGLAYLAVGFFLQAVAYLAALANLDSSRTGADAVLLASTLAIAVLVLSVSLWLLLRRHQLRGTLLRVARATGAEKPTDVTPVSMPWSQKQIEQLLKLAVEAEFGALPQDLRDRATYLWVNFAIRVPPELTESEREIRERAKSP